LGNWRLGEYVLHGWRYGVFEGGSGLGIINFQVVITRLLFGDAALALLLQLHEQADES
jgi:hypothetical protein